MRAALADPEVDFVLLLNNDAVAESGWARELVAVARREPRVGVVASMMLFHEDPSRIENTGIRLLTSGQAVPRDRGRPVATAEAASARPIGACGGAVAYSAAMLRDIGLFEEHYFANFEDVELSLRALATGWDVRYAANARVRHKLSRSIAKVRDDEFLLRSQANNLHAVWTRLPWQVLVANVPSLVLGELLMLLGAPVCGQWRMARIVWRSRFAFLRRLPALLAERRRFARVRSGDWRTVWRRQSGFLPFYLRSFRDIVWLRRRRFFE